jgi:hypothetical protein
MSLKNKVAIVTGGNSGIGQAIVLELAPSGRRRRPRCGRPPCRTTDRRRPGRAGDRPIRDPGQRDPG